MVKRKFRALLDISIGILGYSGIPQDARLGFSVIAHLDPEILLIDEILAVGDINFQKKCLDKIMEFKENSVTIVFVSHSIDDIRRICNRAIWLQHGEIKGQGDPDRIVEEYLKS